MTSLKPPLPMPVTGSRSEELVGRDREREVLERVLASARIGRAAVLVVRGEPGVGKTALLDAVAAGTELHVLRTVGIEGEVELPFAAVQQLCAPILELRTRLPAPQRLALEVAFGLSTGQPPNAFLIGLAIVGLLSEAAAERPLFCIVDDAQWLDRASTAALSVVARRLSAERIALVFAMREVGGPAAGLPELEVRGLGHRHARALLEAALPAPMDGLVLERVIIETRGNPLALLELPRRMSPTQLAGGFGLPAAVPVHAGIEDSFRTWFAALPDDARRLVLLASADPTGDAALVWRAARALGIGESAALAAESEGLVAFDGAVTFRHPLVRTAVYRAAGADERSQAHRALAASIDSNVDPDRRAWHRAQGATMPDEQIAAELEGSAARAQARGGSAAAAAFLERAAALTIDPALRAGRTLAAARARHLSGGLDDALALVVSAEVGPLDEFQRANAEVLKARIFFAADRGSEAPALLLAAAERFEPLNASLARETYLDALTAALFAGRLGGEFDAEHVARAAQSAPHAPALARAADHLLDGLTTLVVAGHSSGNPILRQAFASFRIDPIETEDSLRWLWLAGRTAASIWDYESWDSLTAKQIRAARLAGALAQLPLALTTRVGVEIFAGDLEAAASLLDELDVLAASTDPRVVPRYGFLTVAAFRGREPEFLDVFERSAAEFNARGEGLGLTLAYWVRAALYNGLGRYDEAFAAATESSLNPRELWFSTYGLVELIEAASRSGREERGREAVKALAESTGASATPWALAVEARSRALLQEGDSAESLYREAIDRLEPTRLRLDLARSHLLYGEWLRRGRRRLDARAELRVAHEMFTDFGMEAFAERARIELEATGEHVRKRTVATLDELTPQEAQISRLVALGNTNREIAAQLFISPSTVEYHLRKVFRKLDVTSRTELARRLS
ncbi:MAG TPA: LuxR C-terminal-related transcriptional regulator [Candidatus Limnocylindrales bacterium]|nr:LuxR C-terminal-related transcriptional regulator [Candidatus Limnocylindrales bacterium]